MGGVLLSVLICPVCGERLRPAPGALRCEKRHSFDIARQGYVNLLPPAPSSRRHGDDLAMVAARTALLNTGAYASLRDALCEAALRYAAAAPVLLDAGIGEGYYTAAVMSALAAAGNAPAVIGVDISKTALAAAARRFPKADLLRPGTDRADLPPVTLAVGSVFHLPVPDGSVDLLLSVFAPDAPEEFLRALKPGGVLLRVEPGQRHLMGLKAAVYENPYLNPAPTYAPPGFAALETGELTGSLTLTDPALIRSLFLMTPYYYKTSRDDQAKLAELESLTTEIAFTVFCLRKI